MRAFLLPMKALKMPEPTSSGAAGVVGWKLVGGAAGIAGILGTLIVIIKTRPRTDEEWSTCIISTLVSSLCGGSALVMGLGLQPWLDNWIGAVAIGGAYFVCALPGYSLVRWWFNFSAKRRDADIAEIAEEINKLRGRNEP